MDDNEFLHNSNPSTQGLENIYNELPNLAASEQSMTMSLQPGKYLLDNLFNFSATFWKESDNNRDVLANILFNTAYQNLSEEMALYEYMMKTQLLMRNLLHSQLTVHFTTLMY